MIDKRTPGHCMQALRGYRRAPALRHLVAGLALAAAIGCQAGGWRCEVTLVMDGRTVTGTGTGNSHDVALASARRNACDQLGLDPEGLRRCELGLNPGAETWDESSDCEET
ncbi:MAG: hypothetical protein OXL34_18925 [Gemmatimonadota bacterium]|nr:hypothetical protein [Gemmatimonadota bacterium]